MARVIRPYSGGFSIATVYTPMEYRNRGYAAALIYNLSNKLIDEGAKYLSLFADVENPVSNYVYRKLGFVPEYTQSMIVLKRHGN